MDVTALLLVAFIVAAVAVNFWREVLFTLLVCSIAAVMAAGHMLLQLMGG
ncbi:hypothetical protein [Kineosporia babensis]|uniref:Uncharacterized protein n=1 Tax=Kineosporia babensis TaxID=499548 RepID=A0A9X1NM75_9ACTN|nr:hypothetical protein [Kineosporia babensis]MCD5316655.1 hypothetical protein [Kineosporia babensis]